MAISISVYTMKKQAKDRKTRYWEVKELEVVVKMYIKMLQHEHNGEVYKKRECYEKAGKILENARTPAAVELQMHNISYVYDSLGLTWLTGLKPKKYPGSKITLIIKGLILTYSLSLAESKAEFERKISQSREKELVEPPAGRVSPPKQVTVLEVHQRDHEVVAWVLEKGSHGICESCGKTAPFTKADGHFYLEVHHVRWLADGGSDTTANAIAVCPNCHRELHYGARKEKMKASLYQKIRRLKRE